MSKAITLPDVLKLAPKAAALSNLSVLVASQTGELQKISPTPVSLGVLPFYSKLISDADEATECGIYRTSMDCINLSKKTMSLSEHRGHIIVLPWDSTAISQVFIQWNGGIAMSMRRKMSGTDNDRWESWKDVSFAT